MDDFSHLLVRLDCYLKRPKINEKVDAEDGHF